MPREPTGVPRDEQLRNATRRKRERMEKRGLVERSYAIPKVLADVIAELKKTLGLTERGEVIEGLASGEITPEDVKKAERALKKKTK